MWSYAQMPIMSQCIGDASGYFKPHTETQFFRRFTDAFDIHSRGGEHILLGDAVHPSIRSWPISAVRDGQQSAQTV